MSFYPRIVLVISLSLSLPRSNFFICLKLLTALQKKGMDNIVLCSGSRSGPIALAAGALASTSGLKLFTAIDERSAAFMGLGISTAIGKATVVITTSGTAVSNLLPAAIEADRSCQPIIFITADRPERLKNCGSNQTVNQEEFLLPACRSIQQGPEEGIHLLNEKKLNHLVEAIWNSAHSFPGPVHFNVPIEEPLHASFLDQKAVFNGWEPKSYKENDSALDNQKLETSKREKLYDLNFDSDGIILVGPWRGSSKELPSFNKALTKIQLLSGWPIFADPLSGLQATIPGLIRYWEFLLLIGCSSIKKEIQVLRLGPMPSSRILEEWLNTINGDQVLITEGDARPIDPLKKSYQYSSGLSIWYEELMQKNSSLGLTKKKQKLTGLFNKLFKIDDLIDSWMKTNFMNKSEISEPSLAHWLPKLLPSDIPIMLSASSPIRDWISFAGTDALSNRCFGFRGASGIDGTLSLAIGLSNAIGRLVLVSGDLSLMHDSNGWLFANSQSPPLIVLLIDNAGGGIFKQLGIEKLYRGDFEKLFIMPQSVNPKNIASAYQIPTRDVSFIDELQEAIAWAMKYSCPVLIRVSTNSAKDVLLRKSISYELKKYINSSINKESLNHD